MEFIDFIIRKYIGDWWDLKEFIKKNKPAKKLLTIIYFRNMRKNSSNIRLEVKFKSKPILPHGTAGIFISSGSTIGHNAVIFQQVTIGSVTTIDSKKRGSPVIGDNCYIGAGAKIIGKIKIGNNVRIGANTVVYSDVPDNSIVTSGTQQVTTKPYKLDNTYYFNRKGIWYYGHKGEFIKCPNNGIKPEPNHIN